MKRSSPKLNLLVVAHPDDDTIFFGGLLQKRNPGKWRVVCVTNGNADGHGARRRSQFEAACRKNGVKATEWLDHSDVYSQRLEILKLQDQLKALPPAKEIFTHGILGEYGHPHHQDVSFAVHETFGKGVWSSAYNAWPELRIHLTKKEFTKKIQILSGTYLSETEKFAHLLPATASEGFVRVTPKEVAAIYNFFRNQTPIDPKLLKIYKWFTPYLANQSSVASARMF